MSTEREYVRFTGWQRIQHACMLVLFSTLALTGFPQKFYESGISKTIVGALGGIGWTRFIHRFAGWCLAILLVAHFSLALWKVVRRNLRVSVIVPMKKDFLDAVQTLKYYLGASREVPKFDRYDYRQKFEYWGLVFGSSLMVVTGLILLYPIPVASFLVGDLIPIAKVAHSNEGLMAFLVVIVWHIYNAHLNPDVFPFDTTIFTGKISEKRMHHEHPLELERLEAQEKGK